MTVLPKHWWEGTDAQGRKRDVTATTLEIPLGSGPYRIKEFVAGRSIRLERVKDYWGSESRRRRSGRTISTSCAIEFFRDNQVALRSLQGRSNRLDQRELGQAVGDGLRFPGGGREAGDQGGIPGQRFRTHAGLRLQPAPGSIQGRAAASCLQLCLRFRGDEQAAVLRDVQADQQLFRGNGACLLRTAARPGTANSGTASRQDTRRRCLRRRIRIPLAAIRKRCEPICARA